MAFCRAMAAAGHEVKMLALPYKDDLASISNHTSAGRRHFGSYELEVFRFSYKGIEVVGLEVEQYANAMEGPQVKAQHVAWLENKVDVPELDARRSFVHEEIASFRPTHLLMNEPSSLKIAMDGNLKHPCVRVFIAHDCNNLPFGPFSVDGPGDAQLARLREVEGLWTVSKALKQYFLEFGQLDNAKVLPNHPWIFSDEPEKLPYYDNWDKKYVCAINPGAVKGFHIVHAVAQSMPDVEFLVTKSWSMTEHVITKFEELPNVLVEESVKDMEKLWCRTKVLIVPSICYEAFGLVVVEALLRGIPVISSDAGGLPEAHLNTPWVIPVTPLTGEKETDPDLIEKFGQWKIPMNDPEPWVLTLHKLLWDRDTYMEIRRQGREAAFEYMKELDTRVYEDWLRSLHRCR
ncbi:hypothetical protein SpCBS45565_g06004 [Spizellomyces sp. 'palustris']|nr:hypothetical protein SpCBS45565_g06004 [Spizellomyces sp. 'palustris']